MKKLLLSGFALFAFAAILKADPPQKINLSYDTATKKLKVEAVHKVKNVEDHYIDLISISVDGKEVKVIKPKKQSSPAAETDDILVPEIKKGSVVSVKARCNKFGSKTAELTI
jgi:hypothetical protein